MRGEWERGLGAGNWKEGNFERSLGRRAERARKKDTYEKEG